MPLHIYTPPRTYTDPLRRLHSRTQTQTARLYLPNRNSPRGNRPRLIPQRHSPAHARTCTAQKGLSLNPFPVWQMVCQADPNIKQVVMSQSNRVVDAPPANTVRKRSLISDTQCAPSPTLSPGMMSHTLNNQLKSHSGSIHLSGTQDP